MNTKKNKAHDSVSVRGFYKLKVGKPDANGVVKVADYETDWIQNTITNLGKDEYLAQLLAGMSGSKQVNYAALGTGGAPAATDTSLAGELADASNLRCAVTPTTLNASGTVQFAFTLNSGIVTTSHNIANVGLFNISNVTSGTIFAGNTYTSSTLATNQAVNGLTKWLHMLETTYCKLREFGKHLLETIPREGLNTLVETMYATPSMAKI